MTCHEISVIVPVYNAEKYLERCLYSIVNQTYSDIQIVLVNDGSTDNSYSICKKYADKDRRIILISKENEGVINTRKVGVDNSEGKFICWVDADDWIENDYISNLATLQKESQSDIVSVAHFHEIGGDKHIVKNGIINGVYNSSDIIDKMLYSGKFYEYGIGPHLVTKLFRTEILRSHGPNHCLT